MFGIYFTNRQGACFLFVVGCNYNALEVVAFLVEIDKEVPRGPTCCASKEKWKMFCEARMMAMEASFKMLAKIYQYSGKFERDK